MDVLFGPFNVEPLSISKLASLCVQKVLDTHAGSVVYVSLRLATRGAIFVKPKKAIPWVTPARIMPVPRMKSVPEADGNCGETRLSLGDRDRCPVTRGEKTRRASERG